MLFYFMLSLGTDKIHATGSDQFEAAQCIIFAHRGKVWAHQIIPGQSTSERL